MRPATHLPVPRRDKTCAAIRSVPTSQPGSIRHHESVCAQCPLREQCTTSKTGRRIHRFERQEVLDLSCAPELTVQRPKKIASASGNTSWKEVSPMPPIAMASSDRAGAGFGGNKFRTTSLLPAKT